MSQQPRQKCAEPVVTQKDYEPIAGAIAMAKQSVVDGVATAKEEGKEEGLKEGLKEGIREGIKKMVLEMHNNKFPIDIIIKIGQTIFNKRITLIIFIH